MIVEQQHPKKNGGQGQDQMPLPQEELFTEPDSEQDVVVAQLQTEIERLHAREIKKLAEINELKALLTERDATITALADIIDFLDSQVAKLNQQLSGSGRSYNLAALQLPRSQGRLSQQPTHPSSKDQRQLLMMRAGPDGQQQDASLCPTTTTTNGGSNRGIVVDIELYRADHYSSEAGEPPPF